MANVIAVRRDDRYEVQLNDASIEADVLVLAVPSWRSAQLTAALHRPLTDALQTIRYGSAATVTFAWRRDDVPHALDAFGFVVPKVERRSVLAATFSSVKWPGRAPSSEALLRVFIGGETGVDAVRLDDDYLIATARRELARLMGIRAAPYLSLVHRFMDAMPQYELGHLARVAAIESYQADVPGLFVLGNAYRGVGIPDAIAYAERAADRCFSGL